MINIDDELEGLVKTESEEPPSICSSETADEEGQHGPNHCHRRRHNDDDCCLRC